MKRRFPFPAFLFLLLLLVLGIPTARRAWAVAPLYLDATLRNRAELALTQLTASRGWLLSDVQILEVMPSKVRLLHREHLRRPPPPRCLILSLSTFAVQPCEE
ncbi:MAG: hypothetical protein AAB728_00730 [Patescibacteria group bacterium]